MDNERMGRVVRAAEWWWFSESGVGLPESDAIGVLPTDKVDMCVPAHLVLKAVGIPDDLLKEVFPARDNGGWEQGVCGFFDAEPWRKLSEAVSKTINLVYIRQNPEGRRRGVLRATYTPGGTCFLKI